MKRIANVIGLLCVCFTFGYSLIRSTTENSSITRDPAAIRNNFDFSSLRGEKLDWAIKQRLLSGIEIQKSTEGAGLGLGHFVFTGPKGERSLACQQYSKLLFSFEAEGVSIAGEKPIMEVEGRCDFSPDLAKINPLFIPVAKILKEYPGDGEFSFNDAHPVTVRFNNLPREWPRMWVLKSIKLLDEKEIQSVTVNSDEVIQILGRPFVLNW